MLKIVVPAFEAFDEEKQEFVSCKTTELSLEHSLVSISKWEAKWHKPYLSSHGDLSFEENLDYIKCMTLTQNVDPNVYIGLTSSNVADINNYINNPMTATWFSKTEGQGPSRQIITSEVIYGMMVSLRIPFECQKWHINRLMTLIKVCGENNKPKKKMSPKDRMNTHRSLNNARRARRK